MLIIAIAFPVAVPIAIVLHMWDRHRMQVVAERSRCECCGATLGVASLRRADTEWAKQAAALRHERRLLADHKNVMFRVSITVAFLI